MEPAITVGEVVRSALPTTAFGYSSHPALHRCGVAPVLVSEALGLDAPNPRQILNHLVNRRNRLVAQQRPLVVRHAAAQALNGRRICEHSSPSVQQLGQTPSGIIEIQATTAMRGRLNYWSTRYVT